MKQRLKSLIISIIGQRRASTLKHSLIHLMMSSLGRATVFLVRQHDGLLLLKLMRKFNRIQLSARELQSILSVLKAKTPCSFLVFGFGNDSCFWSKVNKGGRTVFLENNEIWFNSIKQKHPFLEGCLIEYSTDISQWKEILERPDSVGLSLPEEVSVEKWDVIFVDAPEGWREGTPGRMQSIIKAAQLAGIGCDVFVHDCHRIVEQEYSIRFLGKENLVSEVDKLRHFHINTGLPPVSDE